MQKCPKQKWILHEKYPRISREKFGSDDYQIVIAFALSIKTKTETKTSNKVNDGNR